ncbi:MAG: hypothetical protein EBU81_12290, partial [Proteobacteria bacterium]|nr:hypothetical protein [Pseudomonadota bacterium]
MTSQTDSDSDLKLLRETVVQVIADHVGRRDTLRMVKTANYGEGLKFADFGADVRWTTRTQALLNDWNEQGRCVGGLCVQLRGGTGIGALPLPQGVDLVSSLSELGLDRVRRLDLSIDVFDCPSLSVPLFRDRLSSGDWRIPRRDPASFTYTGPIVDKAVVKKGATLYIGGIGDDKRIAIYDKGAQQELDKPWIRFEVRLKGTPAEDALYRLRQASDAAQEHHDPQVFLDGCVVALVRAVLDVRDVSAYAVSGRLPKNWANAGTTTYPEVMHPVFAQVAPLELGSFKATGLYAARVRHLVHSSGRMMWR